jgi:hypothetical protein
MLATASSSVTTTTSSKYSCANAKVRSETEGAPNVFAIEVIAEVQPGARL